MDRHYKQREPGKRKYQNYSTTALEGCVNKVKKWKSVKEKSINCLWNSKIICSKENEAERYGKSRKETSFHQY